MLLYNKGQIKKKKKCCLSQHLKWRHSPTHWVHIHALSLVSASTHNFNGDTSARNNLLFHSTLSCFQKPRVSCEQQQQHFTWTSWQHLLLEFKNITAENELWIVPSNAKDKIQFFHYIYIIYMSPYPSTVSCIWTQVISMTPPPPPPPHTLLCHIVMSSVGVPSTTAWHILHSLSALGNINLYIYIYILYIPHLSCIWTQVFSLTPPIVMSSVCVPSPQQCDTYCIHCRH